MDFQKRDSKSKVFIFPTKCLCGAETKKEYSKSTKKLDSVRRCSRGYACKFTAKEKLKHFVSKEALNIDGLGKKVIEQFWELNFIKEPSDIFNLNYKKIDKLEGWGNLSTTNLKKAIDKSRKVTLETFIYSLGIRHIGKENAKIMAGFFKSLETFKKIFNPEYREQIINNLIELDGIGETQVDSINNFFSNKSNLKITNKLILELDVKDFIIHTNNGIFSNKKVMFTGGFNNMSRSEAKAIAESQGGKVLNSISKKLDFLIVGDSKPTLKKVNQAKDLKIKVILEKEWKKILNG